MVVHVVLFRPKTTVADSDRAAMLDAVSAAAREIPAVRGFRIGTRVVHSANYERLMAQEFPFLAIVEFDDLDGLKAYLLHPKHERLSKLFYELQEAALVYDYEV
ncbi:MAG TPA: Dabb family protein [Gemmatimonadaceae bacterium]|nr:Dabb family protein [Gemmatimonadaceae bacterium]